MLLKIFENMGAGIEFLNFVLGTLYVENWTVKPNQQQQRYFLQPIWSNGKQKNIHLRGSYTLTNKLQILFALRSVCKKSNSDVKWKCLPHVIAPSHSALRFSIKILTTLVYFGNFGLGVGSGNLFIWKLSTCLRFTSENPPEYRIISGICREKRTAKKKMRLRGERDIVLLATFYINHVHER